MLQDYVLFKFQRHSDHHINPFKPDQSTVQLDNYPTYPMGYGEIMGASLIPKLFFHVVDPLAKRYQKGEQPTKEE
jgi:alkane 1-monooxygenase